MYRNNKENWKSVYQLFCITSQTVYARSR